jgi:hypothetical protein
MKKYLIAGGISLVSLAVGAFAGYRLAVSRLEAQYAQEMEEEIQATRELFGRRSGLLLNDQKEFDSPEAAAEALLSKGQNLDFPEEVPTEVLEKVLNGLRYHTPVTKTTNIFSSGEENASFQDEVNARDPDAPYIITHVENMENETGFDQVTVTYYEGDDVLADERDDVIEDHDSVIGKHNLKFGHRSGDKNVVYIRNEVLRIDYEVLRSIGSYAKEVLDL